MKNMPVWVEALIIKAIREFVPVSAISEAMEKFKTEMAAKLKELALSTENKVDDMIVDKVIAVLSECTPDADFLCGLVEKGEDYLIDMLKTVAKKSSTKIDDALVEIIAKALKS